MFCVYVSVCLHVYTYMYRFSNKKNSCFNRFHTCKKYLVTYEVKHEFSHFVTFLSPKNWISYWGSLSSAVKTLDGYAKNGSVAMLRALASGCNKQGQNPTTRYCYRLKFISLSKFFLSPKKKLDFQNGAGCNFFKTLEKKTENGSVVMLRAVASGSNNPGRNLTDPEIYMPCPTPKFILADSC